MIDPLHSLAFSVQANPGVYAVFIGSGVSRSARIPTGWEITLDFVRKLAEVKGETCDPDPAIWYRERYDKEPDYSDILDELAKTPAERHQLLRTYIEASEEDRSEGLKAPTTAHKAIANLAAKGYVRVIITTNFDRLMETALSEIGVVPTVLSSPDQVHGALPLIHTRCCVFKIHGDYLDTRIRNTPDELEAYPQEFNALLDRILDEFGLIVCGWSADWDPALRSAIERAASRRFSHYWAIKGEPGNSAKRLIEHRQSQTISIVDADGFFSELSRMVEAIDQFSRPHPLSTEAAVASLKSYLAEPKYRIRLADLINDEVDRVLESTSGPAFEIKGGPPTNSDTFTTRIRAYEAACETLIALAAISGYWVEDWHHATWETALTRLAEQREKTGNSTWVELQRYPGTLLLYSLGLGAVEAGERGLLFLGKLFGTHINREHRVDKTAIELLPPFCLFETDNQKPKLLEGMERHHAPLNDWLHTLLAPHFLGIIPSEKKYTYAFDKLEVLMALSYTHHDNQSPNVRWAPPGCYGYRQDNRDRILKEIRAANESHSDNSPYFRSGLYGRSAEECINRVDAFSIWVQDLNRRWW